MRNLKKVLSLVMAMAMMLSLMIVGAGAVDVQDFSDAEKIQNTEAVTTLVALGVINGKEDGSYDPEGIVTRAEMAKMICLILNGGKEPALTTKPVPTFADTKGNWAEKYIEYCVSLEIIAGKGDGTFMPGDPVTGSEAAKMALVALGYDATVFGFTGPDWAINTNSRANMPDSDLYDGLSGIEVSAGLSRDGAAQLLFNALDAKVMNRSYDKVQSNGEISYTYTLSDKTLMEDRFGAVKVEGVVIANEFATLGATSDKGTALDEGKTRVIVTNGEDLDDYKNDTAYTFSFVTGENELGKSVSFYVKPASTSQKSTIMGGVIVSEDNQVVTDATADSIDEVADDKNLDLTSDTLVYKNYGAAVKLADVQKELGTRGEIKTFIDNDNDGDVDYIFLTSYTLGKVTRYTTTGDGAITVNSSKYAADDKDDVVGFDDVAKDDYVLTAWIGGKLHVEKAESVTGSIEAYKVKDTNNTSLTVDGEAYNVSWVAMAATDLTDAKTLEAKGALDSEATFYLDKSGFIAGMGEVEAVARNYAFIWGNDASTTIRNAEVKATLPDGTTKTYTLNDKSDKTIKDLAAADKDNTLAGLILNYSITSNGEIKLTTPKTYETVGIVDWTTQTTTALTSYEKGLRTVKYGGEKEKAYATASTVFFYVETKDGESAISKENPVTKVSVYTGYASAPSAETGKQGKFAGVVKTGKTDLVASVFINSDSSAISLGDNYLYIASKDSSYSDYTNATAILAGSDEIVDIKVDDASDFTNGQVYLFKVNSDGYYDLTQPTTADDSDYYGENETVEKGGSSTVILVTSGELKITKDTIMIDITDSKSDPVVSLGGSLTAEEDTVVNVLFDDSKILMVVYKTPTGGDNNPDLNSDVVVVDRDDADTSYDAPTFYVEDGRTLTDREMRSALIAKMTADGCTEIAFSAAGMSFVDEDGIKVSEVEVTYTQVYKVTVVGMTEKDVFTGDKNGYAAAGDGLTITPEAGARQVKVTKTANGQVISTPSTMPAYDITVTFSANP